MQPPTTVEQPAIHRWTRERYDQAIQSGVFGPDDHIELLDGLILTMSPRETPHSVAVTLAQEVLYPIFVEGHVLRIQLPLALDDFSEPEPDLAVVAGRPRDYLDSHPKAAVLLVEISDSTLNYDRIRKAAAYARNGIPEYWIVNLVDRQVERHTHPNRESGSYEKVEVLRDCDDFAPLAKPDFKISVTDLLP